MIKSLVSFGEKLGLPPGIFLAILCVLGAYTTGSSGTNKGVEEFYFLGLYNIGIWGGAYIFLWMIYYFSGSNWFSLNKISLKGQEPTVKETLLENSDDNGLDLESMTKKQLINHAKTRGLNLNMKLKKQDIIDKILSC
ncbi:MAG: hypothetical protein CMM39_06015 [Rhodospirillaceae bacterium]|jgi:hypothetical protein|nr:hypothetical protein [Rhodospirillaceae bacterium]MDG1275191.1 Rho termination factor N-terminal domain-containing protein [Alphaproteobacteria bacterium]|tara:strand:+ start:1779 stop:2192 length:414 start_codon:yes stop_codon:yes gene_type:complete